jgi:hypothetical protein
VEGADLDYQTEGIVSDFTLWILVVSFALGGYGVCLMALWTWRGIVSVCKDVLDGAAREYR